MDWNCVAHCSIPSFPVTPGAAPLGPLIAAAWFSLLPPIDWALYLLTAVNAGAALFAVDLVARREVTGDKRVLVLLFLTAPVWAAPGDLAAVPSAGVREGTTTADAQRMKELEREVKELRRANEILKVASAFFAQAELDRRLKS